MHAADLRSGRHGGVDDRGAHTARGHKWRRHMGRQDEVSAHHHGDGDAHNALGQRQIPHLPRDLTCTTSPLRPGPRRKPDDGPTVQPPTGRPAGGAVAACGTGHCPTACHPSACRPSACGKSCDSPVKETLTSASVRRHEAHSEEVREADRERGNPPSNQLPRCCYCDQWLLTCNLCGVCICTSV